MVFDQNILPLARGFVEMVEAIDGEAFVLLSIFRKHFADIAAVSDAPAVLDLRNREAAQHGRECQIERVAVGQSCHRNVGIGDRFGNQVIAILATDIPERDGGGGSDRGSHFRNKRCQCDGEQVRGTHRPWGDLSGCGHPRPDGHRVRVRGTSMQNATQRGECQVFCAEKRAF